MKALETTPSIGTEISLHSKINSWIAIVFLLVVCKVLSDLLSTLAAKWLLGNNFAPANVGIVGGTVGVITAFVVTIMVGRFLAEIIPLWPPLSGILMTRGATEISRGARIVTTLALLFLALAVLEGGFIAEHSQKKETGRDAVEAIGSNSAAATWVTVAIHDEPGSFVVYADPATIRRSGNLVTVWELNNYTAPQVVAPGLSFLSGKAQAEYDCIEHRVRHLFQAQYSEAMGAGNVVSSRSEPNGWIPIPPGSIAEITSKLACGKR